MEDSELPIIVTCIGSHKKEHIKELARDSFIVKEKEVNVTYKICDNKQSFLKRLGFRK